MIYKGKGNPNIALIKYWGKKDEEKILPETSSISVLLKDFYTITEIQRSEFDEIIINNEKKEEYEKVFKYLDILKNKDDKFKIVSYNNFPTAAGLSSSSSAIVALTKSINKVYGNKYDENEMISISKYGSGSSSRSYTKGYTVWKKDGKVFNFKSKLKMYMFAIIVNDKKKKISSREAMKISQKTSTLFKRWRTQSVKDYKEALMKIRINDFNGLKKIVERNFKLMHKTLLYSDAKYTYISNKSYEILKKLDRMSFKYDLIYTMDAGENVKVFVKYKDRNEMENVLKKTFKNYEIIKSEIDD